jgi:hypothetical protein
VANSVGLARVVGEVATTAWTTSDVGLTGAVATGVGAAGGTGLERLEGGSEVAATTGVADSTRLERLEGGGEVATAVEAANGAGLGRCKGCCMTPLEGFLST